MMTAEPRMPALSLAWLLDGLGAGPTPPTLEVAGIATDSRTLQQGDLFLAAQGLQAHGLRYAPQALQRGAAAVVVEVVDRVLVAPGPLAQVGHLGADVEPAVGIDGLEPSHVASDVHHLVGAVDVHGHGLLRVLVAPHKPRKSRQMGHGVASLPLLNEQFKVSNIAYNKLGLFSYLVLFKEAVVAYALIVY